MSENREVEILFLDFRKEFIKIASEKIKYPISNIPKPGNYNIVAIDESGCILSNENIKADYVLCPHSTPCRGNIKCNNIISCGMSLRSTFGLSSTDKNRSMFSVNRAINFGKDLILPLEEPFKPDNRLSLYENIIIHGIEKLMEQKG